MIRKPIVAGQFYPNDPKELQKQIRKYLSTKQEQKKIIGLIAPHAGYMFSGPTAGKVFSASIIPEIVIIISPNHTGHGNKASIMTQGLWQIPLTDIPVNSNIAKQLMENCNIITEDINAHSFEHSLEVQLPFLYECQPNASIIPLTVSNLNYSECQKISQSIAKTIKDSNKDILIIASSDMNHYENYEKTKTKDKSAIDKILELDPEGLLNICKNSQISMCGVVPVTIMLMASKLLGAKQAKLIDYSTSGDISGDYTSVVGYAGIIIY